MAWTTATASVYHSGKAWPSSIDVELSERPGNGGGVLVEIAAPERHQLAGARVTTPSGTYLLGTMPTPGPGGTLVWAGCKDG